MKAIPECVSNFIDLNDMNKHFRNLEMGNSVESFDT